jgi:hypothetical protein
MFGNVPHASQFGGGLGLFFLRAVHQFSKHWKNHQQQQHFWVMKNHKQQLHINSRS